MEFREYDEVDPQAVLDLNRVTLHYELTPERVAAIRRLDPRPFSWFALYAVDRDAVIGQTAVYRLTTVTLTGTEPVGAISAMGVLPEYRRRGVATALLDEAHRRMREVGLRFSTLGTNTSRGAHALYRRAGYEDVVTFRSATANAEAISPPDRLRSHSADRDDLVAADALFDEVASGRLGFARRPPAFLPMMATTGELAQGQLRLLRNADRVRGYGLVRSSGDEISIDGLTLAHDVRPSEAVAALVSGESAGRIHVRTERPSVGADLVTGGWSTSEPDGGVFMMKPLTADASIDDVRHRLGIGTDRFMISRLDIT